MLSKVNYKEIEFMVIEYLNGLHHGMADTIYSNPTVKGSAVFEEPDGIEFRFLTNNERTATDYQSVLKKIRLRYKLPKAKKPIDITVGIEVR